MGKNRLTPEEQARRYVEGMTNSTSRIEQGIRNVTEAPGQAAAKKAAKMKANLVKSIDDGTWAKRVASVSLEDWKEKAISKGVQRIASGASAAEGKVVVFAQMQAAVQAEIDRELAKMPDDTPEQRMQKALKQMQMMNKMKGKLKPQM